MRRTASLSRRSTDTHDVTGGGCPSGRVEAITHGALLLSTSTRAAHLRDVLQTSLFQALCELTSVYEAGKSHEGINRGRI